MKRNCWIDARRMMINSSNGEKNQKKLSYCLKLQQREDKKNIIELFWNFFCTIFLPCFIYYYYLNFLESYGILKKCWLLILSSLFQFKNIPLKVNFCFTYSKVFSNWNCKWSVIKNNQSLLPHFINDEHKLLFQLFFISFFFLITRFFIFFYWKIEPKCVSISKI